MKKEIKPVFIVAALAGVLVLIGLAAWRFINPPAPNTDTPEARAEAKRWVESFKSQGRSAGSRPIAPGAGSLPAKTHSPELR